MFEFIGGYDSWQFAILLFGCLFVGYLSLALRHPILRAIISIPTYSASVLCMVFWLNNFVIEQGAPEAQVIVIVVATAQILVYIKVFPLQNTKGNKTLDNGGTK